MPHDEAPDGFTETLPLPRSGAVSTPGCPVSPGDLLEGRFEIRRIIAHGGMGIVAEAEDLVLATRVALKFIQPGLAGDPSVRERFRREILLARRITHPNVCRIFELFSAQLEAGPVLFLTMELLDGETLADRLRAGAMEPAEALPLVRQMVAALEAAHAQGIVHRDFKSSNVLLVPDSSTERVVVTDFGIARAWERDRPRDSAMTGEGLLGTPGYMAPEQVLGDRVTPSTDIYALGVVLFEMLTGELPFEGETPMATALLRVSQAAPRLASRRPGVDQTWDAVVATCLSREPVFRYAAASDVLRALEGKPAELLRPQLKETLPAEVTPFLGRVQEMNAAAAILRRPGVRLLTLTGPGGTGKTRLSIEVARAVANDFPDGVTFVGLSNVSEPGGVSLAIATALELREVAGTPIEDVMSAFLRGRKHLLVVDNFEHVLPAAPVIGRLLRAAPALVVLVTSRSVLHLSGEHDMAVSGMGLSAMNATSAEATRENDAVRLFAERAKALSPSFEVADENAADILALCQRLDGLPLAIELAAARIRRDTPRAMLSHLSRSGALQALGTGFHDAERRQQTLRDTIAWSDRLLSEEERALFRALGIFVSGTTLEGASAVGGFPRDETLDLLGSLVDKSLVQRSENPRIEDRFAMLQTLREYALAELDANGEPAVLRARHASHCLAVAESAAARLRGLHQARLLTELEADHEDMRTAIGWFTTSGLHEEALRLCIALSPFWDVRGHWVEGHRRLSDAFQQAPSASPLVKARALHWLGVREVYVSHLEESRRYLDEAIVLSRREGDERLLGESLFRAFYPALFQGDLPAQERYTDELTALAERAGDYWLQGLARVTQGGLHAERGETDRAARRLDEGLFLIRQAGDAFGYSWVQNARGELARARGDLVLARAAYEEVLRAAEQVGSKRHLGVGSGNLGDVLTQLGDWAGGFARQQLALQINQVLGERRQTACLLFRAGEGLMHLGDPELAAQIIGAASASLEKRPIKYSPADREAIDRCRRAIAEHLPPLRAQELEQEGKALTLDEAVLRVLAFQPSSA
jgi:predicted ATPase/tRNA A-37 threonylcarbamoyl transferase component Bud32